MYAISKLIILSGLILVNTFFFKNHGFFIIALGSLVSFMIVNNVLSNIRHMSKGGRLSASTYYDEEDGYANQLTAQGDIIGGAIGVPSK